ncbi:MAG TPA: Ig-like domain-containing protein, partial [Nocardioides sp.]|nr:Ig-like domain-containing protein [Nocardioides sp.]
LDADGVIEIPLDTADYEPGTYELTASYSGDDRYPSASDTFTLTVEKVASDVAADVKPEGKIKPGKKVKVLATVTSPDGFPVSGVVTFTSGGVTEEVELDKHGRADARFSWATAGDHTVTVTYGGNDLLGESTTEVTVHVVKK